MHQSVATRAGQKTPQRLQRSRRLKRGESLKRNKRLKRHKHLKRFGRVERSNAETLKTLKTGKMLFQLRRFDALTVEALNT